MRSSRIVLVAAAALACWTPEPLLAEEAPPTPEAVAERVVAAWKAKDEAAVRGLAGKDDPDPWLVVDALLVAGEREAAAAFAKAAPRKDVERLPAFVSEWKPAEGDAAARAAIAKANAALPANRWADALTAFDAAAGETSPIPRARTAFGRGLALLGLRRAAEAAERFGASVAECARIGWLSRESTALVRMADAQIAAKEPAKALETVRRVTALEVERGGKPVTLARMHGAEAYVLSELGRFEEAATSYRKKAALLQGLKDVAGIATTINDEAAMHLRRGDLDGAIRVASESLAVSGPAGLSAQVARSHAAIGGAHRKARRLTPAILAFEEALAAAEKAEDREKVAAILYDLGASYGDRDEPGDQEKALERTRRALEAFESLGDRQAVAGALSNIADSLFHMSRNAEAKEEAKRAEALAKEVGASWVHGRALQILGEIAEREGEHDEALAAHGEAHSRFEAAGDRVEAARALVAVSEAHQALGDLPKAREHADRALAEAESLKNPGLSAFALITAARVRKEQGLREEALPLARRAVEAYREVGNAFGVRTAEALVKELELSPPR